jgi:5-methyltetrahydrofolate--homocysteine methyltransferase
MEPLESVAAHVREGDAEAARASVEAALAGGASATQVLHQGLLPGMAVVGQRFREREIFLPDVLLAARAMHAAMKLLEPLLAGEPAAYSGRVVLGTVEGDLHDIGKNLVGIMLRGAGFEVVDLGVDVAADRFVEEALERKADVLGLSALLTTTMTGMKDVVDLLRERDRAGRIRTIVGGAPVTAEFAREIGADAHAWDAASAVDRIRALLSGRG